MAIIFSPLRIGIIGCGNIGAKRARAVAKSNLGKIVAIAETNRSVWPALQEEFTTTVTSDPKEIWSSVDIDAVVIATPPQSHIALITASLESGKDVLCEKPLGEKIDEVEKVTDLARKKKRVLKCGFNLRHDRGLERVKELLKEGVIGSPYFFKATYVNGCVLVNTNRVGALSDMGSHLLNLVDWFVGEPKEFQGYLQRKEFPLPTDDNGFVAFRKDGLIGQVHFSLIRWRNEFQLEISGEKGTLEVINLPKWGKQEVRIHRRIYPSGVPELRTEFFEGDLSWGREWEIFVKLAQERDLSRNEEGLVATRMAELIRNNLPLEDSKL